MKLVEIDPSQSWTRPPSPPSLEILYMAGLAPHNYAIVGFAVPLGCQGLGTKHRFQSTLSPTALPKIRKLRTKA
jgi:hypothetical protein